MPTTMQIDDEGLVSQDPHDALVYTVNWADNLTPGVLIATSSWVITTLRGSPGLTFDTPTKTGQQTQVRLSTGVLGAQYRVTNQIVTNETTPQTKERSFYVLVEDR